MCISQIQAIKSRIQEIMKVLFNLTIRNQIWSLPNKEKEVCRVCNGCISISELIPQKYYTMNDESGSYYCQVFETVVNGVISEDNSIPCGFFTPLKLKKL